MWEMWAMTCFFRGKGVILHFVTFLQLILMNMNCRVLALVALMALSAVGRGQVDGTDVRHYEVSLDMTQVDDLLVKGRARLDVALATGTDTLVLDLMGATVDSVVLDGSSIDYRYDGRSLYLPVEGRSEVSPTICYSTHGSVESRGWGGLHVGSGLIYNLGVAFDAWPHCYARTWMPCRDNFYDKATYGISVSTRAAWRSLCSGELMAEEVTADGVRTTRWEIDQPTPTYLVGVAAGPYRLIEREYEGVYGTYPAMIGFTARDSVAVWEAYNILEDVVPMYERCFGPYRWGRIGYVETPQGSMEHVNNIALVTNCMATTEVSCQGVVCHELGHAWFGNLVTCATSADMWINEGGASFCEEVAMEGAFGRSFSNRYYQNNLNKVLRTAHIDDNGYLALHGVTRDVTYGTTTYSKGALVWHSLRGYLGDEVFYAAMQQLFARCAFGNLDAEGLRDSLSAYSGVDLQDFFEFHVMNPGFNDYCLDSVRFNGREATVALRQALIAAPAMMNGNRVPVSFYGRNGESCRRVVTFDGERTVQTLELPFEAAVACVDAGMEISDAATLGRFSVGTVGEVQEEQSTYFSLKATELHDTAEIWLTHHFTNPGNAEQEGVVRVADRYWSVVALMDWDDRITGRFKYIRGTSRSALDYGFYNNTSTIDSMALLYRRDAGEPWQIVSTRHTSNTNEGTFILNCLRAGDYVLGVVDTALLGVERVEPTATMLWPNPSMGLVRVEAPAGRLEVTNVQGVVVKVVETDGTTKSLNLGLDRGAYVARLYDKTGEMIGMQKIIIQ